MKAYIKMDSNNQEELGKFLSADSERIFMESFVNYKTIDELCFDLDMTYTIGTEIDMNGNIAIVDKNEEFIRKDIEELLAIVDNLKGEMILIIEGIKKKNNVENKLNNLTLKEHYKYYENI